jgi:hypothetical protein
VSGSAFAAMVGVRTEALRLLHGQALLTTYVAPPLEAPPPYRTAFCSRCGSPVPHPDPQASWVEVPAGLLEDAPSLRPDKHIFIELKAPWCEVTDTLPQFDHPRLRAVRRFPPSPATEE